jgi:hypothetical protein
MVVPCATGSVSGPNRGRRGVGCGLGLSARFEKEV